MITKIIDDNSISVIPEDSDDLLNLRRIIKAGDKIVYTFHDQTEDYERHLVVTHV